MLFQITNRELKSDLTVVNRVMRFLRFPYRVGRAKEQCILNASTPDLATMIAVLEAFENGAPGSQPTVMLLGEEGRIVWKAHKGRGLVLEKARRSRRIPSGGGANAMVYAEIDAFDGALVAGFMPTETGRLRDAAQRLAPSLMKSPDRNLMAAAIAVVRTSLISVAHSCEIDARRALELISLACVPWGGPEMRLVDKTADLIALAATREALDRELSADDLGRALRRR
jgi:hypothetical protein